MADMADDDGNDDDDCIRCGSQMVLTGFNIYRCQNCGHEEKPEDTG